MTARLSSSTESSVSLSTLKIPTAQIFEPLLKQQLPDLKITRIVVSQNDYIPKINTMAVRPTAAMPGSAGQRK